MACTAPCDRRTQKNQLARLRCGRDGGVPTLLVARIKAGWEGDLTPALLLAKIEARWEWIVTPTLFSSIVPSRRSAAAVPALSLSGAAPTGRFSPLWRSLWGCRLGAVRSTAAA